MRGTKQRCWHFWWGTKWQCRHSFDEVQNDSADTLLMRYKTTVQTLFWWGTKRQCRHSLVRYKITVQTLFWWGTKRQCRHSLVRYKTTVQTLCERRRKLVQSGCWEISLMKRQECITQTRVNIPVSTKLYQPTSCCCLVLKMPQRSVRPYPNQAV